MVLNLLLHFNGLISCQNLIEYYEYNHKKNELKLMNVSLGPAKLYYLMIQFLKVQYL